MCLMTVCSRRGECLGGCGESENKCGMVEKVKARGERGLLLAGLGKSVSPR